MPRDDGTRRGLLVEDDSLVAMLVEDMLDELGYALAGNPGTVAEALTAVKAGDYDVAILDVNLAGTPVFEVADILRARRIPLVFSTGYGEGGLRKIDQGAPLLGKPFRLDDLATALGKALG